MKDLAWPVISFVLFVWFIAACFDQCSRKDGFVGQESWRGKQRNARRVNSVQPLAVIVSSGTPARRVARPTNDDPFRLIQAIGREFDVPAGALYGIWKVESGGIAGGWGQGQGWLSAAELSEPGSECYRNYAASRCKDWWTALQVICGQTRNSVRICDPHQVRTSYAFAMGPMQHLPNGFAARQADGSYRLGAHAVDYDRDGVVDPHDLGDALASTAKLLRKSFEIEGSWQRAINRYYGSQTAGYYDGRGNRPGVYAYWKQWCGMRGGCRENSDARYASR
ncbi:MAG: lytic murein transglycosylase [Patescibacteria group bacterium]|jgi:membrane-bound lytic murein transglycosylase B